MATNLTILVDEADDLTLCEVLITATGRRYLTKRFLWGEFYLVLENGGHSWKYWSKDILSAPIISTPMKYQVSFRMKT